ncbi:O-antigen ligase family protein [Propionibacterium cyclohexanicum]|nr:O-antigen ligase family protein [Propionibacterium cyclohexanicum]
MVTGYLVLLFAIPSNVRIGVLGSLGRPSFLWGLALFVVWLIWRIQARANELPTVLQPIRLAFWGWFAVVMVSLAAALLRGQPPGQAVTLIGSVLRPLSWAGVMLVIMDGLTVRAEVFRLVRRISLGAAALAVLGLVQFATGRVLVDRFTAIPGLESETGGVTERGAFTRPSGTAIHPLEHATVLCAALPLAVSVALYVGTARKRWFARWLAWLPAMAIALGAVLSVSRSAIVGLGVAVVLTIPSLPKRVRPVVMIVGVIGVMLVIAAVPGLLGTFLGLFNPSGDASTQSRTGALARLAEFMAPSPVYGSGFGSFLPQYYIFDNAWALMLVELGVLGFSAFAVLLASAVHSALQVAPAERRTVGVTPADSAPRAPLTITARTLAASVATVAVVFAFFDGMAFPQAAGMVFLVLGLCGAARRIASP